MDLQGGQAEQDVRARRRVPHRADAPDTSLERAEGGADLDPVVVKEVGAERSLVVDLGRTQNAAMWGISPDPAEAPEAEGLESGRHGAADAAVTLEPRLEPLLQDDAERLVERVDHTGRGGVVVEPLGAPVAASWERSR